MAKEALRIRLMRRALELREQQARRTLAAAARELASKRESVEAVDRVLQQVGEDLRAVIDARFAEGTRSVATLIESDNRTRALSTGREQVRKLRSKAQAEVDAAVPRQQLAAKNWRRSEVRLDHVQSLAKRMRAMSAVRASEAEDEEHNERTSSRRSS